MRIADIQRFCMHDGPGIRTTIFLKGCPLHCAWCHNPETQWMQKELLFHKEKCIGCLSCAACPQNAHIFSDTHKIDRSLCLYCGACVKACPTGALEICGDDVTAARLLESIEADRAFYVEKGGVTLSGGEPLAQAEEVISFLKLCKQKDLNTAIETSGYFPSDILEHIVPLCDLFLWDIKDTCPKRHQQYTGVSNERIIDNLLSADRLGAHTRLRCILVNGVNTCDEHYENLAGLYGCLRNCEGIEFMPYHTFGGAKAVALGREDSAVKAWIPSKEQIAHAKDYLQKRGVQVFGVS